MSIYDEEIIDLGEALRIVIEARYEALTPGSGAPSDERVGWDAIDGHGVVIAAVGIMLARIATALEAIANREERP